MASPPTVRTGMSRIPAAPPADTGDVEEASGLPPVPVLPPLLARRLGARVLDPESTALAPGQRAPLPTVYVSDTLLVRDVVSADLEDGVPSSRVEELIGLASGLPDPFVVKVLGDPVAVPPQGEAADSLGANAHVTVTRIRLSPQPDRATKSPDAWRFLQTALTVPSERGAHLYDKLGLGRLPDPPADEELTEDEQRRRERRHRRGRSMASGVSIEHVLTAGGGIWGGGGGIWGGGGGIWGGGGGIWGGGGGIWGGGGFAEYGTPGIGGRTPVVWSSPDPRKATMPSATAPVVAILDTGLGTHPWFPDERRNGEKEIRPAEECTDPATCPGAHRRVTVGGKPIGVRAEPSRDPENTGVIIDDVNGLIDVLCGHGTFIAGVVRQRCPEAVILSVPVMASDGAALEDDVVTALSLLLKRHRAAKKAKDDGKPVPHGILDVVNLSLGYYHETPEEADDTALHDLLSEFVKEGVVVVACAGNDATRARFFPAAFAAPGNDGLVGVGATNPDDRSITLFSNVGTWVTAHAPGAGIVSTVPITLSGSQTARIHFDGPGPGPRSGVDPDDFRSGFAVWSGTSFAAPWIAGEIAAAIVRAEARQPTRAGSMRAISAAGPVVAAANSARFGPKVP